VEIEDDQTLYDEYDKGETLIVTINDHFAIGGFGEIYQGVFMSKKEKGFEYIAEVAAKKDILSAKNPEDVRLNYFDGCSFHL
jgi:transketolase C-terminal domain/subunit